MKNISRVGLTCRHPMYSCVFGILISSCLYGKLTLGKVLISTLLAIYTAMGAIFEEREIMKVAKK